MKNKHIPMIFSLVMLVFAIGFNLWTYRLEPTVLLDPNDNTFQYALVDRTNQIWDYAQQKCSGIFKPFCVTSHLTDHWVPNWAEGYNLPYYYSHVPQIMIVTSWRLFGTFVGLFQWYHWTIYLLLCLFPLSLFISLRVVRFSWITAGIGALLATHLSTDGLYGLDPASFLWRGYGLSSQLFAMIWLPMSIAYAWRVMSNRVQHRQEIYLAILFLIATTAGHLGIGIIAFMTIGILAIADPVMSVILNLDRAKPQPISELKELFLQNVRKLLTIYGGAFLLLAYWIVPILLHGDYHNISFWDPVWKFDSYGAKETIVRLFNGDLFDFGRLPIFTVLTIIGFFSAVSRKIFADRFPSLVTEKDMESGTASSGSRKFYYEQQRSYAAFGLLFLFWLLLYFGRTTWGSIIDLIPGMRDFHLSRFIVGVHLAGLFLIPMGIEWIANLPKKIPYAVAFLFIGLLVCFLSYPQTLRYSAHNDVLIRQANENYNKNQKDVEELLTTLKNLQKTKPGRVLAGRGGSWGKDFRIAETPYYIYLSTYGIPTVLWLPQTWSPNSDLEQYFSEDQAKDYVLYNVRYVVAPPEQATLPFWKLLQQTTSWKLYEVITDGYITTGVRPAIVSSSKESFINIVRLWIQSEYHTQGLYPQITFDANYPKNKGLPNLRMLDEITYRTPDSQNHNLWSQPPVYLPSGFQSIAQFKEATKDDYAKITVLSQDQNDHVEFKASVEVKENCVECLLILKQTFHPSWRATVDGKRVETFAVFPFYTAIAIDSPGTHQVTFSYQPSNLKKLLLTLSFLGAIVLFVAIARKQPPIK